MGPGYVLVLPAMALIAVMMIYPTIETLRFSVSTVRLPTFETTFVGLGKLCQHHQPPCDRQAPQRTIWWVVGTVVLRFTLGFLAACVFNAKVRGTT